MDTQTEKRTKRVGVRVTAPEQTKIQQTAQREHLTVSTWIRRVVLQVVERLP